MGISIRFTRLQHIKCKHLCSLINTYGFYSGFFSCMRFVNAELLLAITHFDIALFASLLQVLLPHCTFFCSGITVLDMMWYISYLVCGLMFFRVGSYSISLLHLLTCCYCLLVSAVNCWKKRIEWVPPGLQICSFIDAPAAVLTCWTESCLWEKHLYWFRDSVKLQWACWCVVDQISLF